MLSRDVRCDHRPLVHKHLQRPRGGEQFVHNLLGRTRNGWCVLRHSMLPSAHASATHFSSVHAFVHVTVYFPCACLHIVRVPCACTYAFHFVRALCMFLCISLCTFLLNVSMRKTFRNASGKRSSAARTAQIAQGIGQQLVVPCAPELRVDKGGNEGRAKRSSSTCRLRVPNQHEAGIRNCFSFSRAPLSHGSPPPPLAVRRENPSGSSRSSAVAKAILVSSPWLQGKRRACCSSLIFAFADRDCAVQLVIWQARSGPSMLWKNVLSSS